MVGIITTAVLAAAAGGGVALQGIMNKARQNQNVTGVVVEVTTTMTNSDGVLTTVVMSSTSMITMTSKLTRYVVRVLLMGTRAYL